MPSDLIRGWASGSREENASKIKQAGFSRESRSRTRSGRTAGSRRQNASHSNRPSVFLANRGRARYQVRAFRAVPEARVRSAAIAQLVEHVIRNDGVTGSSPVCGTGSSGTKKLLVQARCRSIQICLKKDAEIFKNRYRSMSLLICRLTERARLSDCSDQVTGHDRVKSKKLWGVR